MHRGFWPWEAHCILFDQVLRLGRDPDYNQPREPLSPGVGAHCQALTCVGGRAEAGRGEEGGGGQRGHFGYELDVSLDLSWDLS